MGVNWVTFTDETGTIYSGFLPCYGHLSGVTPADPAEGTYTAHTHDAYVIAIIKCFCCSSCNICNSTHDQCSWQFNLAMMSKNIQTLSRHKYECSVAAFFSFNRVVSRVALVFVDSHRKTRVTLLHNKHICCQHQCGFCDWTTATNEQLQINQNNFGCMQHFVLEHISSQSMIFL